jgi:ribosomal protein S12 methylthiotransferase accessory factor
VAATRALLEAVQTRMLNIQGAREDLYSLGTTAAVALHAAGAVEDDVPNRRGWHREYAHTAMYCERFARCVLDPSAPHVPLAALGRRHDDVTQDIAFIVDRLCAAGLNEAIYVDLEQPDLAVPVVRVVVPGLEPITLDRTGWRCLRYLYEPASWRALRTHGRVM